MYTQICTIANEKHIVLIWCVSNGIYSVEKSKYIHTYIHTYIYIHIQICVYENHCRFGVVINNSVACCFVINKNFTLK